MTDPDDYTDPIIEEIRRYREELSLRCGSVQALFQYVREQERLHPRPAGRISFERPWEDAPPSRTEDNASSDP